MIALFRLRALVGGALIAALSPSVTAQSLFLDRRSAASDPTRNACLPLLEWHAKIRSQDAQVDLESEQVFQNLTARTVEAEYLFPLPKGAVARDFELWIGDEAVPAEVLDTEKARDVYESIVRRLRDPALLEYAGCNLLRARIFPIQPGATARIRTRLSWLAPSIGTLTALQIPLHVPEGRPRFVLEGDLRCSGNMTAVFSPGFDIEVVREGPHRSRISAECTLEGPRRMTVYVGIGDVPSASVLCHKVGEEGHFLLTLSAPPLTTSRLPRDLVFVLDRSGSMKGEKMEQAVAALRHGLRSLDSADRFDLVSFATDARPLFGELRSASKEAIQAAELHLDALRATGGTALSEALDGALNSLRSSDRLAIVVLLTDGEPTIGETEPSRILSTVREKSPQGLRLFSFGVGVDVNTLLLDQLAEQGHGLSDYVLPEENLELHVSSFFDRIGQPVLQNLKVRIEGVELIEQYPRVLRDLYANSAVHVLGRYHGGGKARAILQGRSTDGEVSLENTVEYPLHESQNESLPALFAMQKVGFLLEEIRRHGADPELVEEITRLGREYAIVTPYTAALVMEEERLSRSRFGIRPLPGSAGEMDAVQRLQELGYVSAEEARREIKELPTLQSGEKAVRLAAGIRDRTAVAGRSLDLDWSHSTGNRAHAEASGWLPSVRHAAGRTFLQVADTWVDRACSDSLPNAPPRWVQTFSDEYFRLLDEDPELRAVLSLGEKVVFLHRGQTLSVRPTER